VSRVMEVVRIPTSYVEDFINAQGNNVEKRCNFFKHIRKKIVTMITTTKNKFFCYISSLKNAQNDRH
jgi:hypothetical protein